jgi:hypothetical protein
MINLDNPQPTESFTDEFLNHPGPFWEVELPPPPKDRGVAAVFGKPVEDVGKFGPFRFIGWILWSCFVMLPTRSNGDTPNNATSAKNHRRHRRQTAKLKKRGTCRFRMFHGVTKFAGRNPGLR